MRTVITLLTLCLLQFQLEAQKPLQLGVNLTNDGAFTNLIRHTNRYSNATSYDALGWPESDFDLVMLDGRPVPEWAGSIDDPEQYRIDYSGTYKGALTGQAEVRASGTAVTVQNLRYDATSNTTFFDVVVGGYPGLNHGLVFLNVRNTRRTPTSANGSGITDLRIMRPGYDLETNKLFTDEYVAACKAANFSCYRFYNVQNIWDGEPAFPAKTTWQQRKTSDDACQVSMLGLNGKRDGWCWEYIIELANILKKDIWINIHMSCDSMYVQSLCTLIKETLDPSINVYVESSNEVWAPSQNTHGPYNQAEAQMYGISFDENHARRTVELARWFEEGFGSGSLHNRIRIIMAGQQVYIGRTDNHLNFINRRFDAPNRYIYATSTALYFETDSPLSTSTAEINAGMISQIQRQATDPTNNLNRQRHVLKAAEWNLPGGCTSYEGGPHVPAGGGTDNLAALITSHRSSLMGEVLRENYLQGWNHINGGLAMHFTLVSSYNRFGCWGLTDDVKYPYRNYKMRAIRDMLADTATSVEQTTEADVVLYPNPAFDVVHVRGVGEDQRSIVTNLLGQEVARFVGSRLDISSLAPGVYVLRVGTRAMILARAHP